MVNEEFNASQWLDTRRLTDQYQAVFTLNVNFMLASILLDHTRNHLIFDASVDADAVNAVIEINVSLPSVNTSFDASINADAWCEQTLKWYSLST